MFIALLEEMSSLLSNMYKVEIPRIKHNVEGRRQNFTSPDRSSSVFIELENLMSSDIDQIYI